MIKRNVVPGELLTSKARGGVIVIVETQYSSLGQWGGMCIVRVAVEPERKGIEAYELGARILVDHRWGDWEPWNSGD